jgi:hypothetical protein
MISNMGTSAHTAQADEPGEVGDADFDGLGNASFNWNWAPCCTDGIAIADIDWASGCITVSPQFFDGIEGAPLQVRIRRSFPEYAGH